MQNINFAPSFRTCGLLVLTVAAAFIAGCASEKRQTVAVEAAPGYTVKRVSNDTVTIISNDTANEAAGAQTPKK